ncbi:MAG: phosphoribosylamine--glycine ligase [Acidobacteria bacterium]|nr:phosphoribosylamine--glycine ligase [Acidobacteriota bacterium]
MKTLVIGSGGREHAIVWALSHSRHVSGIICAPGNAGIEQIADCRAVDVGQVDQLAALAETERVELTVVGPEVPLVSGIVDAFNRRGLKIVGPTQAAAQLEGSKVFAKEFMARNGIPTASFAVCDSPQAARRVIESGRFGFPLVVKADGLAAGKGVTVAQSRDEAERAVEQAMVDRIFGAAGDLAVVEECLFGRECSFLLFTDGETIVPMPAAQDYKRAFDDDQGPNTGGMGSICYPGLVDESLWANILETIARPTVQTMSREGHPYRGILYIGLMFTLDGPKVLEYNVRMGDPEIQAVLPRLESDLVEIGEAIAVGELSRIEPRWNQNAVACVVVASGGYPGSFQKGYPIEGLDEVASMPDVVVFHAGTARSSDERILTAGGRVLGVTAWGRMLSEAVDRAYQTISHLRFENMHYRRDIGEVQPAN